MNILHWLKILHNFFIIIIIISPRKAGYDINDDEKNVLLSDFFSVGEGGIHSDTNQIIYSYIEGLNSDKIVWFTSTIPQVNRYIINAICITIDSYILIINTK